MNFSIHVDESTLARLQAAVERVGLTRNRIIVLAIQDWLDRNEARDWPEALQAHFRNPAPELEDDTLDVAAWRRALGANEAARW